MLPPSRRPRHLADGALDAWREVISRHVDPRSGLRLLDLGSGTGSWSRAFRTWWPGVAVVAVEPSAAMRERSVEQPVLPGHAGNIPAEDASVDAVWLSTVIHHVSDLPAAAREIRRVLRPGCPVLVRSAFPGRHEGITVCRYWPEAAAVLAARYPSVAAVRDAFADAGFTAASLTAVEQVSASSLPEAVAGLRREAHTLLQLISDAAYAEGVERIRAAARTETGPLVDVLDLLVLR